MIEDPDTVVNRVPQGSCGCGRKLDGQPSRVKARRPQRDIPPVKIQVSECPQHEGAHVDESGMRENGKRHWLPVAPPDRAVYDTTHEKRGREAIDAAGILPGFQGGAVHDRWKPYYGNDHISHALSHAHPLRELRAVEASTGHAWPVATAREAGRHALEPAQVASLLECYDEHIANGLSLFPVRPPVPNDKRRTRQHPATHLLCRLRAFKTEVWRFFTDGQVPLDNTAAEGLVRPVKVKLKLIGGLCAVGSA